MSLGWRPEELVYCSNVHPGADLQSVIATLHGFVGAVGKARGVSSSGAGLWLSSSVAAELSSDAAALNRFQNALRDTVVQLFTLNGFPYGDFHASAVKAAVYQPDWSEPARQNYTLQLAEILAACIDDETAEGTISTLPLGYRPAWSAARHERALQQLCTTAAALAELKQRSGRAIRLCLEMEPGCVVEATDEMVELFTTALPAAAKRHGISMDSINAHLGVCYDVCHQAVMFEDIRASLTALHNAGIVIGKIQISSALEATRPADAGVRQLLETFAEPRYLHQVRSRDEAGQLHALMDLPEALHSSRFPSNQPWRIHFHVPIQSQQLHSAELTTTQAAIAEVLDFLQEHRDLHPHMEVETYTWQVLPDALRPKNDRELITGLKLELQWLEEALAARGLLQK